MHSDYTLLMSMALDDEASADELARLHAHLANCAACSRVWADWQEMDRRMLAAPLLAAPAGLAEQVAARLAERELQARRMRWLGSGLALGTLGLLLLTLVGAVGLFAWLNANLREASVLASSGAELLTGINGLLRGVMAAVSSVGAPALAAIAGGLVCLLCALSITWLWLMGQNGGPASAPAQSE